jgi:arabinogalactan endo-1,4-beta-galactosidase
MMFFFAFIYVQGEMIWMRKGEGGDVPYLDYFLLYYSITRKKHHLYIKLNDFYSMQGFQITRTILCLFSILLVVFVSIGESIISSMSESERGLPFKENTPSLDDKNQFISMSQEDFIGIDGNYLLLMQQLSFHWRFNGIPIENVYSFFNQKGVNAFRLRVFATEEGPYSFPYALQTAQYAEQSGLACAITYFLSSQWTDIGKQTAPASWYTDFDWANLTLDDKSAIITNYTRTTTSHFIQEGIDADIYEIGNEIDYGICDLFETNETLRENISWMQTTLWPQMSRYINAAINGIRAADPTSLFVLHIAHWWNYNFSHGFFSTMVQNNVPLGYLGLSFYPSSGIYDITETMKGHVNATLSQQLFFTNTERLSTILHRPIIVSEYAYPSSPLIIGMFSFFNQAVDGYPLTFQGQKEWLHDFLLWCHEQPFIAGTYYFSPEFYLYLWAPLALFTFWGRAKPAVDSFDSYY